MALELVLNNFISIHQFNLLIVQTITVCVDIGTIVQSFERLTAVIRQCNIYICIIISFLDNEQLLLLQLCPDQGLVSSKQHAVMIPT